MQVKTARHDKLVEFYLILCIDVVKKARGKAAALTMWLREFKEPGRREGPLLKTHGVRVAGILVRRKVHQPALALAIQRREDMAA